MNKTLLAIIFTALGFVPMITQRSKAQNSEPSINIIKEGFTSVPDSIKLAVYWYWISDHISKEGVIKDLESMKAAGINCAFIGNIGINDLPYGKIKFDTPEWWEILHAALKKATELDIEIGIFNSPGWSQSGGPWVKPKEAMRYLAANTIEIEGGTQVDVELPNMGKEAEDVRIIAYPSMADKFFSKSWNLHKQSSQELVADLNLDKKESPCNIIFTTNTPIKTDVELFIKEKDTYRSIKNIHIDRSNPALNVGFMPYAPIVISLPETSGTQYKAVMTTEGEGEIELTLSSYPQVERYAEKSLAKMFQTPLPMWGDYMWEKQPETNNETFNIKPTEVIDITNFVDKDGTLKWNAPEGKWTVMRTSMLPTGVTNGPASPEATGLEIDKMSKKHVSTHFNAFIGKILKRIPEKDRKCFKVVVEDSYETGGQNWTDNMIETFKDRYGYDPVPYIPVMQGIVVGNRELSDRFLWDLRRLVADKVAYDYVGGLREISNSHGLSTWLENYGHWGFPGEFLQYGGQSDEISGEFWSEGSLGDIENRAASSCAHIYGKKRVWAESFTSGGPVFSRYPYMMKQRGDRFFTEGINSTLLHVYIHQAYEDRNPGIDAWFGNEFNRKNTWFKHLDLFIDYLKRCNFMLQQGTYVADVAYFIGEDAPKMTGVCDSAIPKGYSFDYINSEILLNAASVKDGKLVLTGGMKYSLLVLPQQETMRPEVISKVRELVNAGLCITGPAPSKSPSLQNYPEADKKIQNISTMLWGDGENRIHNFGKGKVYANGTPIQTIMDDLQISPDLYISDSPDAPLLFIHRQTDDSEIYFISNQSDQPIQVEPEFRVKNKSVQLWNPLNAECRILPQTAATRSGTKVPIYLDAYESSFIVFRDISEPIENSMTTSINFPQKEVMEEIKTPWKVSFEKTKHGPKESIIFPTLEDWSQSDNKSLRYLSGTARYATNVEIKDIPKNKAIYIDLGKVMVMAKVKINGRYAGGAWTAPYRINITDLIKEGTNTVEVEVANNWMNRLIGDQMLPENQRTTWTLVNPWKADSPLQASGLMGPVEIQAYDYELVRKD